MEYHDDNICVIEDYNPEVLNQHVEYKDIMAELYKQGLQPALHCTARLCITLLEWKKKWLKSVAETCKYINELSAGNE